LRQGFADFIQFERANDGGDEFHFVSPEKFVFGCGLFPLPFKGRAGEGMGLQLIVCARNTIPTQPSP
jgi:hypothetical protein